MAECDNVTVRDFVWISSGSERSQQDDGIRTIEGAELHASMHFQ